MSPGLRPRSLKAGKKQLTMLWANTYEMMGLILEAMIKSATFKQNSYASGAVPSKVTNSGGVTILTQMSP
eukprot:CAMPEP_0204910044 /NCGR_PEP_ID=MMETSP1397-20131031/8641_1 /ASSEMBLY_ACC=CAM_ASM_000891 /TAXON_ID=49980 /ORGANISM="Climacostomum Climacostomum virens, Strain Stock W-24" /LENGTH=69 /DNA_ID=CAMNT_0052080057 /DNA_START=21 /DNA_END=230 /DNA_ORIENTATION=-